MIVCAHTTVVKGATGKQMLCWSVLFFFFRISSSHIVNPVCLSHALVNGPTSKRPASDGGRCSGQLLMMWPAVCSVFPVIMSMDLTKLKLGGMKSNNCSSNVFANTLLKIKSNCRVYKQSY